MDGKVDGQKGETWLGGVMGLQKGRPLDYRTVARTCFRLDPLSLVHGVFFARKAWPWQPKIARAVTSFIEAYDVRPAVSGGVKRDVVINEAETGRGAAEGYGTVPHHRVEYTADLIVAYFCVDRAQLRSYGLSEAGAALLESLIDFEIGTLLDGGLRLRTACDLEVVDVQGERPNAVEAAKRINVLVGECGAELGPVTTVTWTSEGRTKA
jgi:CRISPR-associated protein Csb1